MWSGRSPVTPATSQADSHEQGLLTIVLWTDMHHQGGGTYIAADSVPVIARHLAEHPEGVLPTDFDFQALTRQCANFIELTGDAGDVVLMHPYMLHATSQNVMKHGRLITNPPIILREPMQFDRADPSELSPVERAVLHWLGVDRFDFQRTGEREMTRSRARARAAAPRGRRARAPSGSRDCRRTLSRSTGLMVRGSALPHSLAIIRPDRRTCIRCAAAPPLSQLGDANASWRVAWRPLSRRSPRVRRSRAWLRS